MNSSKEKLMFFSKECLEELDELQIEYVVQSEDSEGYCTILVDTQEFNRAYKIGLQKHIYRATR